MTPLRDTDGRLYLGATQQWPQLSSVLTRKKGSSVFNRLLPGTGVDKHLFQNNFVSIRNRKCITGTDKDARLPPQFISSISDILILLDVTTLWERPGNVFFKWLRTEFSRVTIGLPRRSLLRLGFCPGHCIKQPVPCVKFLVLSSRQFPRFYISKKDGRRQREK